MSQQKFLYQQNLSLQLRKSWSKWSQQKFVRQIKAFLAIEKILMELELAIFPTNKSLRCN